MRKQRSLAVWVVAGGVMLAGASRGWSQQGGNGGSGGYAGSGGSAGGRPAQAAQAGQIPQPLADDPMNPPPGGSLEDQQARMRNSDRQKQLVDDTQKLLALANELKAEVDKSSKDTLSLDVVRKADEIEKLAHNVKEKMKGS
jgi:hypothetical protein